VKTAVNIVKVVLPYLRIEFARWKISLEIPARTCFTAK